MQRFRKWIVASLLVGGLGLAIWQRQAIMAWWHVRVLLEADAASREACVKRVVSLDEAAAPRLVAALAQEDEGTCGNARAALVALAGAWGPADDRTSRLFDSLQRGFDGFSVPGKGAALAAVVAALGEGDAEAPAHLAAIAGAVLQAAHPVAVLRPEVLRLSAALLEHGAQGPWRDACRGLALAGITDEAPAGRIAALRLVLHAPLRDDQQLIARALPLLGDPAAEVRRAALAALGAMANVLSDEALLPLLHDADPEVQRLCELALRGRGLRDIHISLGRLISAADPAVRLQVLYQLRGAEGIDAGVWLRRLSQDPSPAVRAAAIRAAADQKADLRDRLAEMQRQDDSATVRELAGYYAGLPGVQKTAHDSTQ